MPYTISLPVQVHDIKAAIRWLRANAATYQLDPNRFAIMGDSSGGWLTEMATLSGGVAAMEGTVGTTGVSSAVQTGIAFCGPTDFLQMNAQNLPTGRWLEPLAVAFRRCRPRQKRMFSVVRADSLLSVAAVATRDAYAACPFTSSVTPGFSAQKASNPAISFTLGNGSG
ncbi:alpha/beta hydrolase [Streptosporangium sp. NBC_01469]|uniref:alpha/beta hydrolase n=1 Tax=Streptosporangium sp. NBC_01469 TaxID=2903898 RepID=UPI002E2E3C85|nr:alpha/beta hydrolase [Streptosporangium sp. NBC_01469]